MNDILEQLKQVFAVLSDPILMIGDSKISPSSVIVAFLIVFVSFKFAAILGRILNSSLTNKNVDTGVRDSLVRFSRYIVIATGILIALDTLGFSLNSLAALGAVLMVGIGFGLQNITQNFISGIILLIERPVKVGDIVHVGNTSGRIVDIHVRSTVIQTRDDVSVIVPNSKFVSEEVYNDSYTGNRIRQHVRVGVAYGSDVERVRTVLLELAATVDKVMTEPAPVVVFEDFADSSLNFDLRFWCADIWEIDKISSELRFKIDKAFRDNNIQIPFPQRDLHIKSGKLMTISDMN